MNLRGIGRLCPVYGPNNNLLHKQSDNNVPHTTEQDWFAVICNLLFKKYNTAYLLQITKFSISGQVYCPIMCPNIIFLINI